MKWEEEVAQIIALAENKEVEEVLQKFREVGRISPCVQFSALACKCRLDHVLDCLNCSDYEPHETPGDLGIGYAKYETGRVIHLVDDLQTDGFNRSGPALCHRWSDEEFDAVEIYPVTSWAEIIQAYGEKKICKRCLKAYKDEPS